MELLLLFSEFGKSIFFEGESSHSFIFIAEVFEVVEFEDIVAFGFEDGPEVLLFEEGGLPVGV